VPPRDARRADPALVAWVRARRAGRAAARLRVVERRASAQDPFLKYLFETEAGEAVEAVRIPLRDPARFSVCISSQVGCAMGCTFCATGLLGGGRNLDPGEIIDQVLLVGAELPAGTRVSGVVYQGMGEPFANYGAVTSSAAVLSEPAATAIGAAAITVSTVGLVPAIRRYTAEGWRMRLSVSLGAAISEKRAAVMPIERRFPLAELLAAARAHAAARRTRINLAYVLIGGFNCGEDDARALGALLAGLPARLDLIDCNRVAGFAPPDDAERAAFRDALERHVRGVPIARRYSGGQDVWGGCGMLAAHREGGRVCVPGGSDGRIARAPWPWE
jgi:23S rRNA (adenine2503-C2)-methyltransferase